MANYATTTHVYALNTRRTYNTTSNPTAAQITGVFIPAVTGEINSRFAAVGISTPITTSPTHDAYLYVNHLASMRVACLAENSTFMGGNKNESPHAEDYCTQYETAMKAIEENPDIINGIVSGDGGASMDSLEYSDSTKRRDTEPFNRGEDDW